MMDVNETKIATWLYRIALNSVTGQASKLSLCMFIMFTFCKTGLNGFNNMKLLYSK